MENIAIIAEYNPFHNGHAYQLNQLQGTKAVFLSGNFCQHGEITIQDRSVRARHALQNGADLVMALPTWVSLQSADGFAFGACQLVESLNVFDHLAFSTESNAQEIVNFSKNLESSELSPLLNTYKELGFSYGSALKKAYLDIFNDNPFLPNNILGALYLKSLRKFKSDIKPLILERKGARHHADETIWHFASGSYLRKKVQNNHLFDCHPYIPDSCIEDLHNGIRIHSLYPYLRHLLLVLNRDMRSITGYEEGLQERFFKYLHLDEHDFYKQVTTKRYTIGRIKRLIANYTLSITKQMVDQYFNQGPQYVFVLGFNEKGRALLKKIKHHTSLPLITNIKNVKRLPEPLQREFFQEQNWAKFAHPLQEYPETWHLI